MGIIKHRLGLLFVIVIYGNGFFDCEAYYLQLLKLQAIKYNSPFSNNETEAKEFLSRYNQELQPLLTESTLAEWNYYTNLTDENEKISNKASLKVRQCPQFYLHENGSYQV